MYIFYDIFIIYITHLIMIGQNKTWTLKKRDKIGAAVQSRLFEFRAYLVKSCHEFSSRFQNSVTREKWVRQSPIIKVSLNHPVSIILSLGLSLCKFYKWLICGRSYVENLCDQHIYMQKLLRFYISFNLQIYKSLSKI